MSLLNAKSTREVIKNLDRWASMIEEGNLTGVPEALRTQANIVESILENVDENDRDYEPMPYFRPCLRCGKTHNCSRGDGDWLDNCKECNLKLILNPDNFYKELVKLFLDYEIKSIPDLDIRYQKGSKKDVYGILILDHNAGIGFMADDRKSRASKINDLRDGFGSALPEICKIKGVI